MALANERFQTGNHVAIFATGDTQPLGLGIVGQRLPGGTNVSARISTGARPVHVIGDADPQEIVDGAHTYDLTLSMLASRDQEAADRINAGDVEIHVIDRLNQRTRVIAEHCSLVSADVNFSANQLVGQNMTFAALRIRT